jgi:hypothetical protein
MLAESIQHSGERELATVSGPQSPANNLSGFEIQDNGQVVLFATKAEVGEVLHPTTGIYQASIALTVLRFYLVTKRSKAFQCIWCSSYLCWWLAAVAFLARTSNGDVCQVTDTPSLCLTPSQVNG